jgi:hypothetical protein
LTIYLDFKEIERPYFFCFLDSLFSINMRENRGDENPNDNTKVNYENDSRLVKSSNIFLDWLLLIDSNSFRAS